MIKEFRLTHELARNNAINLIKQLPVDSEHPLRVVIDEDKRSKLQNSLMWALLTDLSEQVVWGGKKQKKETWKTLVAYQLLSEIAEEDGSEYKTEFVPTLDRSTLLSVDISTKNMSKKIFSGLVTIIERFGAENGVIFSADANKAIKLANDYKEQLSRVNNAKTKNIQK